MRVNNPAKPPRPCRNGSSCDFRRDGMPACCSFVHPGEGGTVLPARIIRDLVTGGDFEQPAKVFLTGDATYYERMREKRPWNTVQPPTSHLAIENELLIGALRNAELRLSIMPYYLWPSRGFSE